MKSKVLIWIVILSLSPDFVSMAQTELPEKKDTIFQIKPWIPETITSVPLEKGDTLREMDRDDSFYNINPSSRWIRELKNVIVVSPKNETVDSFNIQSPSNIYIGVEGRVITGIRVVRLKPFGTSVTDSVSRNVNWIGKAGNTIHVSTNEHIIRNALMFHEGDQVNRISLAYSERYLRSLRYIDDARVIAIPVSDDEAEVVVIVQDVFPYSVNVGTNISSRANFAITNRNIIGLGVELSAGTFIDSQKDHLMGYEAMLRVPNIGHSFVSFQANYLDKYENQHYGFEFRREFYTPATKYAGHLILYNARTLVRYCDPDGSYPTITPITIRYNHLDTWFGRSFRLGQNQFEKQRKNITVSLGAQKMDFIDRPERSEEQYYRFQNRTTYLVSLAYSQQAFYKTNLIYNFGRTEDIPYGNLFSIVGGREVNEMYDRPYIGANFSSGYFIPKFGYLSGMASYGSFFRNGPDQGIFNLELNYISNLYIIDKFRQRTFINGQYTRQLHNPLNDQLVIDGGHGIPGFRNDSVLGRHRFNLSVEQNFFTPWNFYEFRSVIYAFAYLSWLGGYDRPAMLSTLYSSFGLGVRIRNNRLVFNTLQIQFAYFPNIPKNSKFRYVNFSSETVLQPRDFKPKAPEVMPLY